MTSWKKWGWHDNQAWAWQQHQAVHAWFTPQYLPSARTWKGQQKWPATKPTNSADAEFWYASTKPAFDAAVSETGIDCRGGKHRGLIWCYPTSSDAAVTAMRFGLGRVHRIDVEAMKTFYAERGSGTVSVKDGSVLDVSQLPEEDRYFVRAAFVKSYALSELDKVRAPAEDSKDARTPEVVECHQINFGVLGEGAEEESPVAEKPRSPEPDKEAAKEAASGAEPDKEAASGAEADKAAGLPDPITRGRFLSARPAVGSSPPPSIEKIRLEQAPPMQSPPSKRVSPKSSPKVARASPNLSAASTTDSVQTSPSGFTLEDDGAQADPDSQATVSQADGFDQLLHRKKKGTRS